MPKQKRRNKNIESFDVKAFVAHLLSARRVRPSEEELRKLAADFIEAGSHAVRARVGTAAESSASLAYAQKLSTTARLRMAQVTLPGSQSAFSEPDWDEATSALEKNLKYLSFLPGVVGFGTGYARRRNRRTSEKCVVVFVRKKFRKSTMERKGIATIRPELSAIGGAAIRTDVVQIGRVRRQARAGDSVGPAGRKRGGTIGAFVTDLVNGDQVATTAMHVMPAGSGSASHIDCVCPRHPLSGAMPLGRFRRGTLDRIDAAVISTESATTINNALPELGDIRGWRPMSIPGDYDRTVFMHGAETGRTVSGTIVEPLVHLPSENLDSAILARIPSLDGDSGAALVDSDGLLLGFLVGEAGPRKDPVRIFTPVSLVLEVLACDLPTTGA
jgi:hypothetical protein